MTLHLPFLFPLWNLPPPPWSYCIFVSLFLKLPYRNPPLTLTDDSAVLGHQSHQVILPSFLSFLLPWERSLPVRPRWHWKFNTHTFHFCSHTSSFQKTATDFWVHFLWISPFSVSWKRDLPSFFAGAFFLDSCLFWAPAINSAPSFPLGGSCQTPSDPALCCSLRIALKCSLEAQFTVGEAVVWSHGQ